MAAKNDTDTKKAEAKAADAEATDAAADAPTAADEQPKVQSITSERFVEAETEPTVSLAKADPLTSSHYKDTSKEPRFGVTADEGPVMTVTEPTADAIKTTRAAERKEAELFKVYPDRD